MTYRTALTAAAVAAAGALGSTAAPAAAHDIIPDPAPRLDCSALGFQIRAFKPGPGTLTVRFETTTGDITVQHPFTGAASEDEHVPVGVPVPAGVTPRRAFVTWNTGGHVGGSATVPVASFAGTCPPPAPPVVPPTVPAAPAACAPGKPSKACVCDTCVSRRKIKMRIRERKGDRLRWAYIVDPTTGKHIYAKRNRRTGRMMVTVDFTGVEVLRGGPNLVGVFIKTREARHGGDGKRHGYARFYRLCANGDLGNLQWPDIPL